MKANDRSLGWIGAAAFGLAGTVNFFNLGPVLNAVGNVGIVLFIIGMLIALITGYGWLKLVLHHPDKVGGAAVNSFEYFKSNSPLLVTILCFANWSSWVAQAALSAIYCSTAIIQWLSLTSISATSLAILILFCFIGVSLTSLTIAGRIAALIGIPVITLGILSAVLPLWFGNIHINTADILTVQLPFPGWFGYLTAIMSGFYLVGWIVPAYEVTTWLTGEMREPNKNLPRAFITTALVSSLTFIILPLIWLSTLGYSQLVVDYTTGTNWLLFSQLFPGFGPTFASICGFLFIISYMLCSGIGSMIGPARMLVQLSEYGLFPRIFQKRSVNGAPWVAISSMGVSASILIIFGTPLWLIAATNFGYLACMILASLGAWLLWKENPTIGSKKLIFAGAVLSMLWVVSILFGFQQYGITAVMGGISFVLLGAIFYLLRKISESRSQGKILNPYSIHVRLPLIFFVLMALNGSGFLLVLLNVSQTSLSLVALLQDIFIAVILITITVGLWITDSVAHAAVSVSHASRELSQITMPAVVKAMESLGMGDIEAIHVIPHKKIVLKTKRQDELGIMINNFSDLENQIENIFTSIVAAKNQLEKSREKILHMNAELENRVIERTTELEKTQKQLIDTARRAGMSEIATSILHNIGNILNSVKVTISLLQESSNKSEFNNIFKVATLMKEKKEHLADFLLNDTKGKVLPNYLIALIDSIYKDNEEIKKEITGLKEHINHIESIVEMQNTISGVTGVFTKVFLPDTVNTAIKMCLSGLEKKGINLTKEFQEQTFIKTDESKLIQILVNLIKNAADTLSTTPNHVEKNIIVKIAKEDDRWINIQVTDNGMGIAPENLTKIFSLGFTTKKQGHGFGLHSSANSANEMGGALKVASEGLQKGSTFTLTLPAKELDYPTKKEREHVTEK